MAAMASKRSEYRRFLAIPTRWMDNDPYGHVNNVVFYSWFDTAVNRMLIDEGLLDIGQSPVVSLVVETGCTYFESVAFPEIIECGLAVTRLGGSSITYALAVFRPGAELAAAQGHFVHVCVDRHSRRPVAIPAEMRAALQKFTR
jgi:acyl-CoA thioester hydrolase